MNSEKILLIIIIVAIVIFVAFLGITIICAVLNRGAQTLKKGEKPFWRDRRHIGIGLPWTFDVYSCDDTRLYIESGLLNSKKNEVRLYRILDLSLSRPFWLKILGLGVIKVNSSDKTVRDFELRNICHAEAVMDAISVAVEEERTKKRVGSREIINDSADDMDDDMTDES
ncbi:MAG: PH domain-containing protein [Lachnospiraceae bacterium]|nr:PH domain-containing protein [Lachnospiraceae bacterium]